MIFFKTPAAIESFLNSIKHDKNSMNIVLIDHVVYEFLKCSKNSENIFNLNKNSKESCQDYITYKQDTR